MGGCRGVTHGYSRAPNDRARALVIGCNYTQSKSMRLWGACNDARQWASTLTGRLGVPVSNMALLTDEAADGEPIEDSSSSYPSQRNIHEHLTWLTNDPQPGDLLAFIFCGRGTMLLEGEDPDEATDTVDDEESDAMIEEGLLCADFESADWVRGYTMRLLTGRAAAGYWEALPRGVVLTTVVDCEHGLSILPVPKRLDSSRLPPSVNLNGEPTPVMEALVLNTLRTVGEARQSLRQDALPQGALVPSDPRRGGRSSNGVWPQRHWLRGQMLWEAASGDEEACEMDAEVQAFGFCAGGFFGHVFEAIIPRKVGNAPQKKRDGSDGPSQRRGVLTHCVLQALEEMNFQGSYYALWWRAISIMRKEGFRDQHFQLTFSDGTDPTCREVFEPLGAAEAMAYKRRADRERILEDREANRGGSGCATTSWEPRGFDPDAPLSARDTSCGCGVLRRDAVAGPALCALM